MNVTDTQPVAARTHHWAKVNVDWLRPDGSDQPWVMLSWDSRKCWCLTPWSHD